MRTAEGICIERLMQEPAPATLLFEILYPLGFNTAQIGDIYRSLEGQPGKIFTSEHWCIVKDREYLLIEAHRHPIQPALAMEEHVFTSDFVIPRDKNTACFDADKLTHPLLLRPLATRGLFYSIRHERPEKSKRLYDRPEVLPFAQRAAMGIMLRRKDYLADR